MNELFEAKKTELEIKYADRIAGIAEANGFGENATIDKGVAFDFLASNVERGTNYVGGGECTVEEWTELIEDFKALRILGRG
jgi:hypothetical protein